MQDIFFQDDIDVLYLTHYQQKVTVYIFMDHEVPGNPHSHFNPGGVHTIYGCTEMLLRHGNLF